LPEPEPPPGDLLLESRVEYPQATPQARRIERDGTVYDLGDTDAQFEDGEWRVEAIPLAWREVTRLDEGTVRRIEDLARGEDVLELAGEHVPEGTVIGGGIVTWTLSLDGDEHVIRLVNMDVSRFPPLAALDHAVQMAVGESLHPDE
jgi:hypothetical protein